MHEKLSHLSPEQIEELMRRYYNDNEKVKVLIQEFEIDIYSSNLVNTFPPQLHSDTPCPYGCSDAMVSARVSRSSYAYSKAPCCPICNHKNVSHCSCKNCRSQAAAQKEQMDIEKADAGAKKQEIFIQWNTTNNTQAFPTKVSAKDALYLLALSRHSVSEDFSTINPFKSTNPKLAPTLELQDQMVGHLYKMGYIAISKNSNIEAFTFDDGLTKIEGYYPTYVTWSFLPGRTASDKTQFLRDLEATVENDSWA